MAAEAPAAAAQQQQQPQGRSWKSFFLQIIVMQLVMKYFRGGVVKKEVDPSTGLAVPPLINAFSKGLDYDLYVHVSPNATSSLWDFVEAPKPGERLLWSITDLTYSSDYKLPEITSEELFISLTPEQANSVLSQKIPANFDAVFVNGSNDSAAEEASPLSEKAKRLVERYNGGERRRLAQELRKTFSSLHLIATAVPHSVLPPSAFETADAPRGSLDFLRSVVEQLPAESRAFQARGSNDLVDYMPPQNPEFGTRSLLSSEPAESEADGDVEPADEIPYWKMHEDLRVVVDHSVYTVANFLRMPHMRRYTQLNLEQHTFSPAVMVQDLWLIEKNYLELNASTVTQPLPLTLSVKHLSPTWFMLQAQLAELWGGGSGDDDLAAASTPSLLTAMQAQNGKRESFMVKRIILDTNPWFLGFSVFFMLAHSVFSALAFKNDISFWRKNESMHGLSALSVVFNFICEVIIGLYLFHSEKTSFLILFEIFLGIVLSAWKVTKALTVSLKWDKTRCRPVLNVEDRQSYAQSETKEYDRVAIKWASVALFPCLLAYAAYSLVYKKHKGWYGFVISTLAGTVYTFGFVMMTPQLYINYKLKSVDHLPWRAFTYKAMNTFVDDIAAFIIDMPVLHRLACFRDDVIFVCYLYQRWIYRVDKSRPSEWHAGEEQQQQQAELEPAADTAAAAAALEETKEKDVIGGAHQRRGSKKKIDGEQAKEGIAAPAPEVSKKDD